MPQEKDALDRHLFYTVPLKQINAALSAHGGKATKPVQGLANKRSKAGITTKPVEDENGKMAHCGESKVGNRFRKPERLMGAAISAYVVGTIHRYDNVSFDVSEGHEDRLSKDCFTP